MQKFQQKAWMNLTEKERTALQLTLSFDKSPLEAAVLMNIYPYKFNELLARGKTFFFMFSSYYEFNSELITEDMVIDSDLKAYLEALIVNRYTTKKACLVAPDFGVLEYSTRAISIGDFLEYLKEYDFPDLYNLIIEFDRWNAFRILPRKYQKVSPFRRRQNRIYKKIAQKVTRLTELSYFLLKEQYSRSKPPLMYLPLVSSYDPKGYSILEIPLNDNNKEWMGKNHLPCFRTKEVAYEMAMLLKDYSELKNKSSYMAKKFYPEFKSILNKAVNLYEVLEIKDFRTALEDMGLNKSIKQLTRLNG
jgi:hypothetical protein